VIGHGPLQPETAEPAVGEVRGGPKSTLEIALMADGVEPAKVYEVLKTPAGVVSVHLQLENVRPHFGTAADLRAVQLPSSWQ
jgi:hypothetical protein